MAFFQLGTPENAKGFRGCQSPHPAAADLFHSLLDRSPPQTQPRSRNESAAAGTSPGHLCPRSVSSIGPTHACRRVRRGSRPQSGWSAPSRPGSFPS